MSELAQRDARIGELNLALGQALAEIERLRAVMQPFSEMAGELFARNWNNPDIVIALDNPNDPHRLTARDFFAVRMALVSNEQRAKTE